MSLNIKSEVAHQLVRELAEITGESQTAAVTTAVQEKLARIRKSNPSDMSKKLLKLAKQFSEALPAEFRNIDHGDILYGNDGLPK